MKLIEVSLKNLDDMFMVPEAKFYLNFKQTFGSLDFDSLSQAAKNILIAGVRQNRLLVSPNNILIIPSPILSPVAKASPKSFPEIIKNRPSEKDLRNKQLSIILKRSVSSIDKFLKNANLTWKECDFLLEVERKNKHRKHIVSFLEERKERLMTYIATSISSTSPLSQQIQDKYIRPTLSDDIEVSEEKEIKVRIGENISSNINVSSNETNMETGFVEES